MPSSDPELLSWLRQARADAVPTDESTCLDPDTLGALADGSLDDPHRVSVLPHLASCARCRAAVASIARLLADPAVARELAPGRVRAPAGRWLPWTVPLAAAALLVVVLGPLGVSRRAPGGLHRATTLEAGSIPEAVHPVGDVTAARELQWQPVTGADRYRVTIFAPTGEVVYAVEGAETATVLPDSVALVSDQAYLWKVEARVGFDRWVSSPLVPFSLFPDPERR